MKNVSVIIGTAGHVDHGKTTLIKALTGTDTDRLREEKERQLSIDLGFAPFELPGGRIAGVVDVPGHEKFMRNMLAGISGIDLVLLVVDAQEGIMPQTMEHLDVLKILGVREGIIVVTKIDLVEEEWLELMCEEIGDQLLGHPLADAPIIPVSAVTGQGIDELIELIDELVGRVEDHSVDEPFRLPVDRSFHLTGFGTVITGTLLRGEITKDSKVQLLPQRREVRVRQLQVHGQEVERAQAGQRVALNLSNITPDEIPRGTEVVEPGYYQATRLLDVRLKLLEDFDRVLENRTRVHLHIGTNVVLARVLLLDRDELLPGQEAFAQLKLEEEVVAHFQDRFIIRFYSPVYTIGGGRVLEPEPQPHRRFQEDVLVELELLASGRPEDLVVQQLFKWGMLKPAEISRHTGYSPGKIEEMAGQLEEAGKILKLGQYYLHPQVGRKWSDKLLSFLEEYHEKYPLRSGVSKAELQQIFPDRLSREAR
ncbi:MAG: selenocysteine-specific translation elongation factor, partial [Halanaerobium sp.]|nr:selenocysteine-specific translation elongation factor [Halanaerobium sp.]